MNSEYIFNTIIPPCLVIFGILGNLLCLLVFTRKKFQRLPLNFLFRFMAITDNIALLTLLQMSFKYSSFHFDITIMSTFTCKLLTYVQYFVPPIKGWILVIIAIERYFSVINPRQANTSSWNKFRVVNLTTENYFQLVGNKNDCRLLEFFSSNDDAE